MSEVEDIEAARAAYARVRPLYKRLAQEVRHILEIKLADAGLTTVSITDRPKDIDSSPRRSRASIMRTRSRKMTDLAGARVVCAYESELAKVAEVVEYASTSTNCATSALTGWVTTARHLL